MKHSTAVLIMEVSRDVLQEAITGHMKYLEGYAVRFRRRESLAPKGVVRDGFAWEAREAEKEVEGYLRALLALKGDPVAWFERYEEHASNALIYWQADRASYGKDTDGIVCVRTMLQGANA